MMHGHEKSRSAIVAVKPTNKAERSAAESVERRAETKGNVDQQRTRRTQRRISVSQMLARIRQHIVAVDTQGGNRMRESCTYGFCEPTTIPPLRVLLVPAASARPGLGPGDKPVHLAFGLCLALLFRTVRGCLKEGVDRSTDVSIDDRVVGAQLGLQEKLCTGFQNGRELRPQRRNEVRHGQRNYAQADERKRTAFQYVIENSHDLSIAAWLKLACKHPPSANASAKVARTISEAGAMAEGCPARRSSIPRNASKKRLQNAEGQHKPLGDVYNDSAQRSARKMGVFLTARRDPIK